MPNVRIRIPGGSQIVIPHYPIDMVGANERAASFSSRSIKKQSKIDAIRLAISMVDLTTLEGADTPGKVRQLCQKAVTPIAPSFFESLTKGLKVPPVPSVGAVCVYPRMIPVAREALAGSSVNVASVSTAFPSGQVSRELKLRDVKEAVALGAQEIDMVIDRGAFLSGKYQRVFDEIVQVKEICGADVHLKVILETGELLTYDRIRLASWMAMEAGADFIKTSTGKVGVNATLPITLVMLQAIQDYYEETGRMVGMKPAGGIRNSKLAIHYLCMVKEVLGRPWLSNEYFRFGASALLNDLLRQLCKEYTGRYYYKNAFSVE